MSFIKRFLNQKTITAAYECRTFRVALFTDLVFRLTLFILFAAAQQSLSTSSLTNLPFIYLVITIFLHLPVYC